MMNGAPPCLGSLPEITETEAGRLKPTSAMPYPAASSAIPRWTALARRSKTLVVATEQLAGCRGIPTTQFSRSSTLTRRALPPLGGTWWSTLLKMPIRTAARAVDSLRLRPHGRQSRLSRRSTSMEPAAGSMLMLARTGIPSSSPGMGSCLVSTVVFPVGSLPMASAIMRSL